MKHRTKNRIVCGIILCSGALCFGGNWTWDDGGAGQAWTTCGNWHAAACFELPDFPSTTNDDVDFSVDAVIVMSTVTIDDMSMAYDVEFDGNTNAVLTVDSLRIDGNGGDVTLTVKGGATVVANGSN